MLFSVCRRFRWNFLITIVSWVNRVLDQLGSIGSTGSSGSSSGISVLLVPLVPLVLFVVDSEQHLHGSLTDGDIRRFLVAGGNIEMPVTLAMNAKCRYVDTSDKQLVLELHKLKQTGINVVPVVDENHILTDTASADIAELMCVASLGQWESLTVNLISAETEISGTTAL